MKLRNPCLCIPALLALALIGCDSGGQSGHEGRGTDQPAAGRGGSGGHAGTGPSDDVLDGGPQGGTGGTGFGNCEPDEDSGTCFDGFWPDGGGIRGGDKDASAVSADGGAAVGEPPDSPLTAYLHVCAQSTVEAPSDCMNVCGLLHQCDARVACDTCLERCAASGHSDTHGTSCLALAIYWIDEEGCDRVLQEYANIGNFSCPE